MNVDTTKIDQVYRSKPLISAEEFRNKYTRAERDIAINSLSPEDQQLLIYDWSFWRRDNQKLPEGQWTYWVLMAGRGAGKTRTGAETVRQWIREGFQYVNLIGPTASDIRDVMVEGQSGILAVCPNNERPIYYPSKTQLVWPNGAISLLFSAEEPERLRGKAHSKLWCDELAAWRYAESWDQAQFGLRIGDNPQCIVTTTPRPTALIRELLGNTATILSRGTSYDNRDNLAPAFYAKIITKYEGTRLGRQELEGQLLEDNPGALFFLGNIEKNRVGQLPTDLERIVIPIDPAVTSKENSDETGIVPVAMDKRNPPHFYVIEDLSDIYSPDAWAKKAVEAYRIYKADRIIGETNNGGEMIESTIRHVDENVSYKAVHASRGKVIRAEPVAALYEQNRVHHLGILAKLEDQMTNFNPSTYNPAQDASPDRMDSLVWVYLN